MELKTIFSKDFTPGPVQDNGNTIRTVTGEFMAVRTGVGWSIFFCGYTHTGQLIGGVISGKFTINQQASVTFDIDKHMIELTCLLLHCCLEDDKKARKGGAPDNDL